MGEHMCKREKGGMLDEEKKFIYEREQKNKFEIQMLKLA